MSTPTLPKDVAERLRNTMKSSPHICTCFGCLFPVESFLAVELAAQKERLEENFYKELKKLSEAMSGLRKTSEELVKSAKDLNELSKSL